ncbi:MAG: nicotinate (nicotinamide) nucleotide adenylyltransferase [Eubacteriales bacterium]|nr:nicotinate (nicotinamide) nucleotide adenylyltransferase [Eubacteriales bacterium]
MKIGVFGGAFDPPHMGHIRAARRVLDFIGLDLLYIVPAYVAPLKEGPSATPEQRLEMCRLAFSFDSEKAVISDYEIAKGGISYTKDTIRYFLTQYPDPSDTLYLIIGTDQLMQLNKWKKPEYIFANTHIAVVSRYGDGIPEKELEKYASQGARLIKVDIDVTEVSSTEIRCGDRCELIDNKVKEYIEAHGLYR